MTKSDNLHYNLYLENASPEAIDKASEELLELLSDEPEVHHQAKISLKNAQDKQEIISIIRLIEKYVLDKRGYLKIPHTSKNESVISAIHADYKSIRGEVVLIAPPHADLAKILLAMERKPNAVELAVLKSQDAEQVREFTVRSALRNTPNCPYVILPPNHNLANVCHPDSKRDDIVTGYVVITGQHAVSLQEAMQRTTLPAGIKGLLALPPEALASLTQQHNSR